MNNFLVLLAGFSLTAATIVSSTSAEAQNQKIEDTPENHIMQCAADLQLFGRGQGGVMEGIKDSTNRTTVGARFLSFPTPGHSQYNMVLSPKECVQVPATAPAKKGFHITDSYAGEDVSYDVDWTSPFAIHAFIQHKGWNSG